MSPSSALTWWLCAFCLAATPSCHIRPECAAEKCPAGTSYHATEGKDKSEWKCDLIQPSSHGSDLKEWRGGYRLGSLIQILTSAYAEGKTTERVTIVRDYIDQVTNFH